MSKGKGKGKAGKSESIQGAASQDVAADPAQTDILPSRVRQLILQKNYERACDVLQTLPKSKWILNTLGVCAMRCGRIDQAIALFRSLLLIPGTTIVRPDADDILRVNFATALLLNGNPSGACDALEDLRDSQSSAAMQVKETLRKWEKSLPFWRRWDWKLTHVPPKGCSIPIDFEPGQLHVVVAPPATSPPGQSRPPGPKMAA